MKIKYTPGTEDGLVGKTFTVEIIQITLVETKHVDTPLLTRVKIKYEDGRVEEIGGTKLFKV